MDALGVFDAADAAPVGRDDYWPLTLRPGTNSDFVFIRRSAPDLAWNTVAVWQAMSRDEDPPRPEAGETPIPWLLWRLDLTTASVRMDRGRECEPRGRVSRQAFRRNIAPFLGLGCLKKKSRCAPPL